MSRPKLSYRPEIDGLRAVAVVAVILYHLAIRGPAGKLFEGGFLGVDVFLVISGYLIASLILKEYTAKNSFSFSNFYARRVRRLLPALLLVLVATLPVAWVYMLPSQMVDFAKSMISALLFGSNFYFHFSLQEYGAESSLLKPLLHCWSLSLEEQYYLFFPVGFVVLLRYLKRQLILVVCVLGLASLALAQWSSAAQPSMAFYLLPWRAWELLGGVLLAAVEFKKQGRPRSGNWNMGAVLGLVLILGSIVGFGPDTRHPSLLTVIPVFGTMLVIWFAGPRDLGGRLLSSRPLVWIGLISYSLYLWHFPIFAFGRLAHALPSHADKVLWLLLSFSLAAISYRWVERPFRDRSRTSRKRLLGTLSTASLLLFAFAFFVVAHEGVRSRFDGLKSVYGKNEFDNKLLKQRSWTPLRDRAREHGFKLGQYERTQLWYSDPKESERTRLLVVGNSHSKDLYNALALNPTLFPHLDVARYSTELEAMNDAGALRRFMRSPNFQACDTVIVSNRYYVQESADDIASLTGFVRHILKQGKTVIVASNTPEFFTFNGVPVFDYYARNRRTMPTGPELAQIFYQRLNPRVLRKNARLKKLAKRLGVTYVDKVELTCQLQLGQCAGVTPDGYKMYYDYGHLTLEGARYLGQLIQQENWLRLP